MVKVPLSMMLQDPDLQAYLGALRQQRNDFAEIVAQQCAQLSMLNRDLKATKQALDEAMKPPETPTTS